MPNGESKAWRFNVDAYLARDAKWEPYDLCSDAVTAAMADGVTSLGAQRIDEDREKLAEEIARHICTGIMAQLKSRDLRNGYPQE